MTTPGTTHPADTAPRTRPRAAGRAAAGGRAGPDAAAGASLPWDIRFARRAAQGIGAALLMLAAAAALQWLARSPVFTLRAIEVDGDLQRHSLAELRAHAMPRLAGNFFSLDLRRAQAVFEDLPWVRRAEVRRVWPDRLRVTLQEHQAAALWEGSAEAGSAAGLERLVNTHGELFDANPGEVEDDALPVLTGPAEGVGYALALHGRLQAALAPLGVQVLRLQRSGRGAWRVELDSGARVELGRGSADEVLARSERFVRTVGEVSARFNAPLQYADLRHADGYAVRLAGITTQPPAAAPPLRPRQR
jgi:cell division protein FtsQ